MKRTAFIVLGMHRSGTSSVAGALAQLGAAAPRTLMAAKPENPKGFWESEVIMALNDDILAACGSSWDDWRRLPTEGLRAGASFSARATAALREEFGDADTIVLKDPRICRFYPFWREILIGSSYEPLVISPIRAPGEVVASLTRRNTLDRDHAFRLWLRHVLDAEAFTRGQRRHLVGWSDFLSDWKPVLTVMSARLGREIAASNSATAQALDGFLSVDLRREREAAGDVPAAVGETYRQLMRLSAFGEVADAFPVLDRLRSELDAQSGGGP